MELETLEHLEHAEHAAHAAHEDNLFITTVSMTIAVLAVIAATVGSMETLATGGAIAEKNAAVLKQSQASDQWAFYQSKSLKKNMYDIAAAQATASGGKPEDFEKTAERYDGEIGAIKQKAEELEHERDEKLAEGDQFEHRHHILTIAVTIIHVAIAVSTVAIITKGQKWPWYTSIVLTVLGICVAAKAYIG